MSTKNCMTSVQTTALRPPALVKAMETAPQRRMVAQLGHPAAPSKTLLVEKSPFFDQVCERWPTLFPDSVAKPGRWQDGRLFLYVRTSGQLFGMRPKLTKIKKALATLPTAPKRFSVHLEIR